MHGKLRIGQSGTAGDRESMENLGLVKVEQLATENPRKVRIGQSGIAGDRESMGKLGLVKVEQLATENAWKT